MSAEKLLAEGQFNIAENKLYEALPLQKGDRVTVSLHIDIDIEIPGEMVLSRIAVVNGFVFLFGDKQEEKET